MMLDEPIDDDEGARQALDILTDPEEPPERRGEAVIKLGPGLQSVDERMSWADPSVFFSRDVFEEIDDTLRTMFFDASTPELVRRRILEAAVRCPGEWHEGAIRAAWQSDSSEWRVTALFSMDHVPGFEDEIRTTIRRPDLPDDLLREAVRAAGRRGLAEVEPIVREVALDDDAQHSIRLDAIDALIWCGDDHTEAALRQLTRHNDPEIADHAQWALDELRMFNSLPDDPSDFDPENLF